MIARRSARLLNRTFSTAPPRLLVLGLESSADDTCCSVVSSSREILSSVVLKQGHVHETYGGIHPLLAQEAHQANIGIAVRMALSEASVSLDQLDGVRLPWAPWRRL